MNILCCFKIVPDLDLLSDEDWVVYSDNNVDVSFVKNIWNCFDESALEMLLKLSDTSESFNMSYNLSALTIGNDQSDSYLKTLYALGYEKAVRIECNEDLRFSPELTARMITEYIKEYGSQEIIVMGNQASVGDNGKTPLLTAEYLRWPCVTEVTGIESVDEEFIKVESITDNGVLTQIIKTPCVLSIGNAPNSYLRVPTLKDRMRSGKKPIETIVASELLNLTKEEIKLMNKIQNLERVDASRAGTIVTGDSPEEKAFKLYNCYLKERIDRL